MRKLIYLFIFLLSSYLSFSQTFNRNDGRVVNGSTVTFMHGNHLPDDFLKSNGEVTKYKDIEGSPYIDNNSGAANNLPLGKVYSTSFEYLNTAFIRYNAHTDNMEVSLMEDGVDYYLLKREVDFLYLVLHNKKYRAYEYLLKTKKAIGFFVILSENDTNHCSLLKKEKIVFKKKIVPKNSFISPSPPSFKRNKDIYYLKLDDRVVKLPKKKKELYTVFLEKKNEMKEFIASNKFKLTKEEDLLAMTNYYNSLLN